MDTPKTLTYDVTGAIARITLNRPERGNGITFEMPAELAACVERANLDPAIHVIALSGNGKGFCGGYDLVMTAEQKLGSEGELLGWPKGSPMDPKVQVANHDPEGTWDPMVDYAMMSRNVRGFMSLFYSDKPVICKVHGFCVAGGTGMALWAYRIGAAKAKRLLFTGDCLTGKQAAEWGLATESAPADKLDEQFENLLERVAKLPINQLVMMKLLINQTLLGQGLQASQMLGTIFDGVARHTKEGYAFQQRASEAGFKQAVKERDEPFAGGVK